MLMAGTSSRGGIQASVEKCAVSMMLAPIPQPLKDDLISTMALTPLQVTIAKLTTLYQPGRIFEKTVILKQLRGVKKDLEKAAQLVIVLTSFQRVHGVLDENFTKFHRRTTQQVRQEHYP